MPRYRARVTCYAADRYIAAGDEVELTAEQAATGGDHLVELGEDGEPAPPKKERKAAPAAS
jgi:hypothetical protein